VTYLEVDVLQPAHDNAVERVLWEFQLSVGLQALYVDESTDKLGVKESLVGQTLDVLSSVRVDVLEGASELIVEPLNE
jgi:hypothetical protein